MNFSSKKMTHYYNFDSHVEMYDSKERLANLKISQIKVVRSFTLFNYISFTVKGNSLAYLKKIIKLNKTKNKKKNKTWTNVFMATMSAFFLKWKLCMWVLSFVFYKNPHVFTGDNS